MRKLESTKSKIKNLFLNPQGSKIKTFAIFTGENPNRIPSTPAENREYNKQYDKRCNDIVYAENMDKWLNDSVDDKLNFRSRYLCRIDLYGKKNK